MGIKIFLSFCWHETFTKCNQTIFFFRVPDAGVEWPTVACSDITICRLNYLYIAGPDNLEPGFSDDLAQTKFWNSIGLGGL